MRRWANQLPKETIVLNPSLIGKIDPTSDAVKDKERREEAEKERLERFKNRRKKNTRKLKDHIAKDAFRDQIRREHVVQDRQLRKQLYQAERAKAEGEVQLLEGNVGDIVRMSKDFLRASKRNQED